PAARRQSLQSLRAARFWLGHRRLEDFQCDELRWLSRRWRDRMGGTEPGRWAVALRWQRRCVVPVDLLWPPSRHAGVWRRYVAWGDLEGGCDSQGTAGCLRRPH